MARLAGSHRLRDAVTAEYQRQRRAAKAIAEGREPGKPGPPVCRPCGTIAAYRRHERRGFPPCDACKAAHAEYQRDYYRRRKG